MKEWQKQVIQVARLIFFLIIVHDFSLPAKQGKIHTNYFCLMLVLTIPQIETEVVFVFNLRLHIVLGANKLSF